MTFNELFHSLTDHGWLSYGEAALLHRAFSDRLGDILEIGCYRGRSTKLLASLGRRVIAVDPMSGFNDRDPSGDETERLFRLNLAGFDNVELFRCRVEDWTPVPIGCAYLDGDHTYAGTLAQIAAATACGAKVIAAHDVTDSSVGRACREKLGPWVDRAERLAYWELP